VKRSRSWWQRRRRPSGGGSHPDEVLAFLEHQVGESRREYACRAHDPHALARWQQRARPALARLIGLDAIAESASGHRPRVELEAECEVDGYVRRRGEIESEPGVRLPFWLLRPRGAGPFPLALTAHGHERGGADSLVGLAKGREGHDVAVQAVRRGFVTLAPATRGIGGFTIADLNGAHGDRDCRSHWVHSLLAGRTCIGERVWDVARMIDWATSLPGVDGSRLLMIGNSGGGVLTLYAAACEPRITAAVSSCAFSSLLGRDGLVHHCDCNAVPGILRFGELWDVAGLIAPRPLLVVNGAHDPHHSPDDVAAAAERLRQIYAAAGAKDSFAHLTGEGGHRFYPELLWSFAGSAAGL
jgi:dienelactone hydrolase